MGLSETIIAAMIGALATVATALFQLISAVKAKGRVDLKPRRTTARSIFAIVALMVASAGGGFLYSQFLLQRSGEDIRAMRQELRELRDLTAARVLQTRPAQQQLADVARPEVLAPAEQIVPASLVPASGIAESIAYVPACRVVGSPAAPGAQCEEKDAQRIALCGTVPAHASVRAVRLFAQPDAVQHPWEQHTATLDADVGGARFTGRTFEYAQGENTKAVCINFLQWSSQHPHIARIVVQYSTGAERVEPIPAEPVPVEPMPLTTESVLTQAEETVSEGGIRAAVPGSPYGPPATALR